MNKILDNKVKELQEILYSLREVKEFFRLKKALQEDEKLMELEKDIRVHQRRMGENLANDQIYHQEKEKYLLLKAQYDHHPVVANYEAIKSVVYDILKQVKDILE